MNRLLNKVINGLRKEINRLLSKGLNRLRKEIHRLLYSYYYKKYIGQIFT